MPNKTLARGESRVCLCSARKTRKMFTFLLNSHFFFIFFRFALSHATLLAFASPILIFWCTLFALVRLSSLFSSSLIRYWRVRVFSHLRCAIFSCRFFFGPVLHPPAHIFTRTQHKKRQQNIICTVINQIYELYFLCMAKIKQRSSPQRCQSNFRRKIKWRSGDATNVKRLQEILDGIKTEDVKESSGS